MAAPAPPRAYARAAPARLPRMAAKNGRMVAYRLPRFQAWMRHPLTDRWPLSHAMVARPMAAGRAIDRAMMRHGRTKHDGRGRRRAAAVRRDFRQIVATADFFF
ncbi:tetraspanin-2-like [Dorcoceras hygrometricum]|uniref:Tetraspanin-2-like n=1 Tax=Dorcoceras hygrometricum TaxID=472368 RepID=A0A2Z6ZXT0_9LAMI|nr:tetraspanin-2-like [Dorcoceras hygrometricum]